MERVHPLGNSFFVLMGSLQKRSGGQQIILILPTNIHRKLDENLASCCCCCVWFWSRWTDGQWTLDLLKSPSTNEIASLCSVSGNCPWLGAGYPLWLADQWGWESGWERRSAGTRETELTFYTLHCLGLRKKQGGPLRSSVHSSKLQLLVKKQPLANCDQQTFEIPFINPSLILYLALKTHQTLF